MTETPISLELPALEADTTEPESKVVVARQWQLIWWKFRKHRLAVLGGVITILIYLVKSLATDNASPSSQKLGALAAAGVPQLCTVVITSNAVSVMDSSTPVSKSVS